MEGSHTTKNMASGNEVRLALSFTIYLLLLRQ
jgi:hypothetical protein